MSDVTMKELQAKILEIMVYVDQLCRKHGIVYYIMGGTALGAVRHQGFIPWDDDLDIFMTPSEYRRFREVFFLEEESRFELQEWRLGNCLLEYAKVRLNGTTFIEANFRNDAKMHHGIYIDIMILHKCPQKLLSQIFIFACSRYVTLQALAERNWVPKTVFQRLLLYLVKVLPKHFLSDFCYKRIYRYDDIEISDYMYCYFITPARFSQAVFAKDVFMAPAEIEFEAVQLYGPTDVDRYLKTRYGDYMKLPPEEKRLAQKHAEIVSIDKDFSDFFNDRP